MPKFIPLQDTSRLTLSHLFGRPRIYLRRGIWCCRGAKHSNIGHGYSPKEAYRDWLDQILDVGPLAA